ncbi:MAG: cytochrome P450 [Pseudomonadales bacterium]
MSESTFYSEDPDYVRLKDNTNLDHIPGDYGRPLIGYTFDFVQRPFELMAEQRAQYGDVFRFSSTFQKSVVCLGPEYIKQLTLDSDKVFSSRMGYEAPLKHFFEGGLLMRDFAAHKFHRRIMQAAFKTEAMRNYVDAMHPLIDKALDQWEQQDDFLFYPNVKELLLDIGAKVFLGLDLVDKETTQLNEAFLAMGEGTMAIIRKDWPLPGLAYRKGMNGRRFLDQFFLELVPDRRGKTGSDMATFFSNETTESGELFPDEIVSKHLIFLLLAAHDTTTAALSMACHYLAHDQKWQSRLREEAQGLCGSHISYDELAQVSDIGNTFKEIERLHPSVPSFMRRTVAETEIGGYRIPAHTPIQTSVIYAQRMEEWWSNPHEFDPDRFARNEHKQHPFQWAPFGGGAHKCIGIHFADMLFKAVMSRMLKRYRFSFPEGHSYPSQIQHFPFPKPADHLPLVLSKI